MEIEFYHERDDNNLQATGFPKTGSFSPPPVRPVPRGLFFISAVRPTGRGGTLRDATGGVGRNRPFFRLFTPKTGRNKAKYDENFNQQIPGGICLYGGIRGHA